MTPKLLILRPLDGALQTERQARSLGLKTVVDPLFVVEAMPWSAAPAENFDALLLTSANAARFGGPDLKSYRSLPVLAVGSKTAAAAEKAGFDVARIGEAGAQELLEQLADDRLQNLLWLAGDQHTDIAVADRRLEIVPVYRAKPVALGDRAKACLAGEAVILLHSARAARHLVAELERLHFPKSKYHLVTISAKVAEAAGQGWKGVQSANHPDDDALLSLASALCRSLS